MSDQAALYHDHDVFETLGGWKLCRDCGQFEGHLELLDEDQVQPLARKTDPPTSLAAAASAHNMAKNQRDAILRLLNEHPAGLIHTEIDELLNLHYSSAGKRLPELERLELAYPTDETRPTPSGRQARVWRAVQ